jgi:hypothetical protein
MASKPNYTTTNKSDRNIDKQFDQRQFNLMFEANEKILNEKLKAEQSFEFNKEDEIIYNKLPHQKPIVDTIINVRETFYKSIEMLSNGKNPSEFILSSPDRFFSTSIFLLVIGSLLLLLSNLMKSQ